MLRRMRHLAAHRPDPARSSIATGWTGTDQVAGEARVFQRKVFPPKQQFGRSTPEAFWIRFKHPCA